MQNAPTGATGEAMPTALSMREALRTLAAGALAGLGAASLVIATAPTSSLGAEVVGAEVITLPCGQFPGVRKDEGQ